MKTKSLLLATALLMSTSALAQKNTFKGVVLDDLGEPLSEPPYRLKASRVPVQLPTLMVTLSSMQMLTRPWLLPTLATRMPRSVLQPT